ncbi:MAG: tetratricopeptide repeat protein [Chloracidobacterium sp.]|nr:tetratricopeptide repeat protein [Chloracidobacterium sp.]
MNKENLLFAVLGLMIGLIVGFMFANSVNRDATTSKSSLPAANQLMAANSALPPNHPPIGNVNGQSSGMSVPEVSAAIEKARSEPQNYEAQMTAADLYYQIQRFDEAAKFYEAASKVKPAEAEPLIKAGNAFYDGGKFLDAEKWYREALKKAPNDKDIRNDLALTFLSREPADVDRAIAEFNTILSADPKFEKALQNLAFAYREKGDQENLAKTLERLKKVNPNNPELSRPSTR